METTRKHCIGCLHLEKAISEGKCFNDEICNAIIKNLQKPEAHDSLLADVRATRPDIDRIKYFIKVMERPSADQSIEMLNY